ncbi:endolytic transglycosylase MltG [candidate division KSB1 bacterium]|nr:MAG: endolytic transglycosylase MltG [candidate division KSB1 bacterium]
MWRTIRRHWLYCFSWLVTLKLVLFSLGAFVLKNVFAICKQVRKGRVVVFLVLGFIVLEVGWSFFYPNKGCPQQQIPVIVKRGMNVHQIARLLAENRVVDSPVRFVLVAKLMGASKRLHAGAYKFRPGSSNFDIVRKLRDGQVITVKVTIPEGLPATRIAAILQQRIDIDSARFVKEVMNPVMARTLGIAASSLEGFLYPDTYYFYYGMDEKKVIHRLVNRFKQIYTEDFRQRAQELGMTQLQVVTLASIIQGEAMLDSELSYISAVYHNRLKRGLLLQADPTVQYLVKDGPRRLLKKDLTIDSPYNTYLYPGLPPGPINNPGVAAIRAALYPAKVGYLYFVARGDGSHVFSCTLQEHLRAKRKLDQIRRQVYRK